MRKPSVRVARLFFLHLVFGLFLAGGLQAAYADPPHASVASHNDALASSLQGTRVPAAGERPRSNPLRYSSLQVHAVFPSVDGVVSSHHPPRELWGWSYDAQDRYGWQGDLTGCGSNRSRLEFNGASGSFRLHASLAGRTIEWADPPDPAALGFSSAEWASVSGRLSIRLSGRLFLHYDRETQQVACRSFCYWNGCSTQSWVETVRDQQSYSYPLSSSLYSYAVIVPSSRLVAATPWIHNFSGFLPFLQAYAFSNSSWYFLESRWDGRQTGRHQFFVFDVASDGRGAQSVRSVFQPSVTADPVLPARFSSLAAASYRHAYRVDQDLDRQTRPGMHDWSLKGVDFFGDATEWAERFSAHVGTVLNLYVSNASVLTSEPLVVSVRLSDRSGRPLSGKTVRLESAFAVVNVTTDWQGTAVARLGFLHGGGFRLVARFVAQDGYASSFADAAVFVQPDRHDVPRLPAAFDGLLFGLVLLLGLCAACFRS